MSSSKILAGKLGMVLCGALLGGHGYGQPSVSVGVTVPTPSVTVVIHADSDFYEPLTPHGEWVSVGTYGRCWRPGHVARDWRPYCNGSWELTDDGWYWVSDEPWAWATYHYGRWDFTEQYGWYWVPQTQWAPAWVSWHEGGGYVGWAPLQPSVSISVNGYVGFNQSHIPPRAYVFVEQRHFMEPIRPTTVVINNTTIINKTTVNISNTRIVNNTVINGGPASRSIEKASGRKVQAVKVQELRHKEESVVVAKPRTQAPVHTETAAHETKTKAVLEPAHVEKPVATPRAPAGSAPAAKVNESEKHKSVPVRAEARAEAPRPAEIKESPAEKKHETQIERQKPVAPAAERKTAVKPESRAEGNPQRAVRERPAVSETHESRPQEKHEERIKD